MKARRLIEVVLSIGISFKCVLLVEGIENGDEIATSLDDRLTDCQIYLAESTIPNAGLGIYSSTSQNEGDIIDRLSDIVIPYGVFASDEMDLTGGQLANFNWAGAIKTSHVTMPPFEGTSHLEVVTGLGALTNHHSYYNNFEIDFDFYDASKRSSQNMGRAVDRFDLCRPHSGTDAFTPFQDVRGSVQAYIPAGSEIFANYGEAYFLTRHGFYQEIPLISNYDEANDIMQMFSSHLKKKSHPSGSTLPQNIVKDLWHVIRTSAGVRTKTALWNDINKVINHDEEEYYVPKSPTRSPEWFEKHGSCMDHLRTGVSSIFEAGRGAFARRSLSKGEVLTPVPVMQMNRTLNLHEKRIHPKERLLVNYCYGHSNSTMILCPYVSSATFINHSKEKVNAKIQPSTHPFFNKDLLNRSARLLIDNFEPLGTVFEIVATKDINVGEEIFLNYGDSWQRAWNNHCSKWENEFIQTVSSIQDLDVALQCIADYEEPWTVPRCIQDFVLQQMAEIVSFQNGCFFYPPTASSEVLQDSTDAHEDSEEAFASLQHWTYSSPDGRNSIGGLFACQILAEQNIKNYFTAVIEVEEGRRILVRDIPFTAIRKVTKKWLNIDERRENHRKDLNLPEPFRHPIMLPDDVFPSNWMDLNFL